MTGRLKLLAAALGFVLATGTIANVSAETLATATSVQATTQTQAKAPARITHQVSLKSHRLHAAQVRRAHTLHAAQVRHARKLHLAQVRNAPKLHVAHVRHVQKVLVVRHHAGTRIVKAGIGTKTTRLAGKATIHRERHAMNHRIATKPVTVVR